MDDKLISANSLYKKLSTNSKGERIPEHDVDNFPITLTLREIKKIIMDEPAAFDKEKVIGELKDNRDEAKEYHETTVMVAYEISIEIVEKGGVE